MKGIVFTEFLTYVSKKYDENTVDDIIEASHLPSGGAYTTVGTYDHAELVSLCRTLSESKSISNASILNEFGKHLGHTFYDGFRSFFDRCNDFFDFVESIDEYIHKEVRKLYPDAQLPTFVVSERSADRMVLDYISPRHMEDMALGLLEGTAPYFDRNVKLVVEKTHPSADGSRFIIEYC